MFTNIIQSPEPRAGDAPTRSIRLHLHPLDLLTRMSPLAFIQCVAFAHMTGELERVRQFSAREMTPTRGLALAANGMLAFVLNVVSFTANRKVGPLSMTVAGKLHPFLKLFSLLYGTTKSG